MSQDTVNLVAERIGQHVVKYGLDRVRLTLHGGEPLLAGPASIEYAVQRVRAVVGSAVRVDVSVQTNGVLLDERFLDLFDRLHITVGISLDGYASLHDSRRRHPDGRGTYAQVTAALKLLSSGAYRHLFGGLLCTIDVRSDPIAVYEALLGFAPPAVDFLLPHGSWSQPPPVPPSNTSATPYADWLGVVFDRWYSAPRRETGIRLLQEIISLLLGGNFAIEGLGLVLPSSAAVTTDGHLELSDAARAVQPESYGGAAGEGGGVTAPHLADIGFEALDAERADAAVLCGTCRQCPVYRVCGGGLHAHRYREGHGFSNPSVYCADLYALIRHVEAAIAADVSLLRGSGS